MNPNVAMTLDEAVGEVLGILTGHDLMYKPEYDRYRVVTRLLNRALRGHALEAEWSYYSDLENVGTVHTGDREVALRSTIRVRGIGDDAVRLVDADGHAVVWAYLLPRDSLHKYGNRPGIWAAATRGILTFSRPLGSAFAGLEIHVPVMREPKMFELPPPPENPEDPPTEVPDEVREQLIDYDYPDVIIARAAYLYAQTDPVMQPRVPTLEGAYKDMMYQLVERDTNHTDSPYLNEFFVPISNSIDGNGYGWGLIHPHSDERR